MSALATLAYLNSYSPPSPPALHTQVLCTIAFSLNDHEISLESQSCLVVLCQDPSPPSIPFYFQPCATPYLLELSEVSL